MTLSFSFFIEATRKKKRQIMWRKEGALYIFTGDQRSDEWFKARKNRITASRISAAIGDSRFSTVDKTVKVIMGEIKEDVNENMMRGIKYEDAIRELYEEEKNVKVTELGFVFREDLPHMGVSPDGLVGDDGLIEIKCPDKLYPPLIDRSEAKRSRYDRWKRPLHIWKSHYDQMIAQMAVMGRLWCDYVVYGLSDSNLYIERVKFNDKYWNSLLLPQINKFIRLYLKDTEPYIPSL